MSSFLSLLAILPYLCLVAANITINTDVSMHSCLKLNSTKTHVVENITLQKCCQFGWHLDTSAILENRSIPCVEGDQNITIDMVYMVDESALRFELLELANYSVKVSTLLERRAKELFDAGEFLVLNQNGVLGGMDEENEKCNIVWCNDWCVDYDIGTGTGQLVGVCRLTLIIADAYVLIPCMAASILCLAFVIFVYLWIPPLNDLTGKALVGLSGCLMAMYLCYILQYSHLFDDVTIVEHMEGILKLLCGIWFILLWGIICANVWCYLPRNYTMDRQQEFRLFLGLVGLCVVFFIIMLAVAICTEQFSSQYHILVVILFILAACTGISATSWLGFNKLKRLQQQANRQSQSHPEYKFRTLCTSSSYILFYACLCFGVKYIRQTFFAANDDEYELFNALAGFIVFLVFLCRSQSRKMIAELWQCEVTEDVYTSSVTELVQRTNR